MKVFRPNLNFCFVGVEDVDPGFAKFDDDGVGLNGTNDASNVILKLSKIN